MTLERYTLEVGGCRQPTLRTIPVREQPLLNLVQHLVLEVLGHLALEQIQSESVDRADEHLGEAVNVPQRIARAPNDPLLQLCRRLVCIGEGHDVDGNRGNPPDRESADARPAGPRPRSCQTQRRR